MLLEAIFLLCRDATIRGLPPFQFALCLNPVSHVVRASLLKLLWCFFGVFHPIFFFFFLLLLLVVVVTSLSLSVSNGNQTKSKQNKIIVLKKASKKFRSEWCFLFFFAHRTHSGKALTSPSKKILAQKHNHEEKNGDFAIGTNTHDVGTHVPHLKVVVVTTGVARVVRTERTGFHPVRTKKVVCLVWETQTAGANP